MGLVRLGNDHRVDQGSHDHLPISGPGAVANRVTLSPFHRGEQCLLCSIQEVTGIVGHIILIDVACCVLTDDHDTSHLRPQVWQAPAGDFWGGGQSVSQSLSIPTQICYSVQPIYHACYENT